MGVYRAGFTVLGNKYDFEKEDSKKKFDKKKLPLIIVSSGSQLDAFSNIDIPNNAICLPSVPQVRLFKTIYAYKNDGLAAVITHGGQNSFMEALSIGAPVIICPGFGDQMSNGIRAEILGIGMKVDRPIKQKKILLVLRM